MPEIMKLIDERGTKKKKDKITRGTYLVVAAEPRSKRNVFKKNYNIVSL